MASSISVPLKMPRMAKVKGAKIEAQQAPPLWLLVGNVEGGEHRLSQVADTPQGNAEIEHQAPAERFAWCLGEAPDLLDHDLIGLRRQYGGERTELRFDGRRVGGEAVKRDQRRDRGEDGEQRIEGAARGHDRQIVFGAFAPHSLGHLPPALERDAVRTRGVAAVRIGLAAHGSIKMAGRS
jgi:hypothetical protein